MEKEKGKESKRKKHRGRGKECAAAECNIIAMEVCLVYAFFKFPTENPAKARWCNLTKRQHGRDGFRVGENTVICEKHFRKHEIIKVAGGVRS